VIFNVCSNVSLYPISGNIGFYCRNKCCFPESKNISYQIQKHLMKHSFSVPVRHIPRAVTTRGVGGGTPPNVVILQFCRTVLTILTTLSSGKKYVIEQKMLHNLLKSDSSSSKFFDKFTKILLKNCPNYGTLVRKLVKNGMSEIFLPCPPVRQRFWEKKY
jgi:hypothetical protein